MIQKCGFFITRLDNKVIKIDGLYDSMYDNVQIIIESKYLTDEDIRIVYSHYDKETQDEKIKEVRNNEKLYFEGEVMWSEFTLSRYKTEIIYKDIEIN